MLYPPVCCDGISACRSQLRKEPNNSCNAQVVMQSLPSRTETHLQRCNLRAQDHGVCGRRLRLRQMHVRRRYQARLIKAAAEVGDHLPRSTDHQLMNL